MRAALVVVFALGLAGHARASTCPTTQMNCGGSIESSAAADSCSYSDCNGSGHASFNAVLGRVAAAAQGGSCSGVGLASVRSDDDFQVGGVAPGTPLAFMATLTVSQFVCPGSHFACCAGTASAALYGPVEGDSIFVSTHGGTCISLPTTVQVMIQANAGEPFRVVAIAQASGNEIASGTVVGILGFTGLPAGASVTSCRGFVQSPAPTLVATWGKLKSAYR